MFLNVGIVSQMANSGKLSSKQQAFVYHYLTCWNAAESARRAGYNGKSNVVGSQLLANLSIKAEIERRKADLIMSADEVMVRFTQQARAEYSEYIREDSTVDVAGLVKAGKAHLIKKIKPTRHGKEIEFYDAQGPLELIGKQQGLFTDKIEVKLAKEVDTILDVLERSLDADSFTKAVQALSAWENSGGEGQTQTREASEQDSLAD
jgi:hypothetical protein